MNCFKQRTMLAPRQAVTSLPQKHWGLLLKSESRPMEDSFLEQNSNGNNKETV